jgi:ABC-type nitrate/sulfonate/bicarbonate transport system permease component
MAEKTRKTRRPPEDIGMAGWIGVGSGTGVALGATYGDIGLGLALGAAIGIIIGGLLAAEAKKRDASPR